MWNAEWTGGQRSQDCGREPAMQIRIPHSAFRVYPCSFLTSSVSFGTTSNKSPTIP